MNLTCDELRALLYDHCAGELVIETQESFRLHLCGCPDCAIYAETYTCTIAVARKLSRPGPLPVAVEARLWAAVLARLENPPATEAEGAASHSES